MANRYDDAVKALCDADLGGLCTWLGMPAPGPVRPMRLAESAPVTTTRAVDLLVDIDASTVLHVEFQTHPEPHFARRMLDYWLRLHARDELAGREIVQHVIQLGDGQIAGSLSARRLHYSFEVHRLRDEDPDQFLTDPALAPYASLARMPHTARPAALAAALTMIANVDDHRRRDVLFRATVDLAAIRLDPATIESTWKETAMPVPSLLGRIEQEALERGHEAGREEGLEQGLVQAVASLLRVRFGDDERIGGVAARLARLGAATAMAAVEAAGKLDELT